MNRVNSCIYIRVLISCLFFLQVVTSLSLAPLHAQESELPIVVLICSYNNQDWVEKNLDSVFMQEYNNFRVIYIDDCSQDKTASHVQSYINTHNLHEKITLISNPTRCRKMKNMYTAVRLCQDHEIVVQLDGDDWFIDTTLFAHINHIYQTKDIWLTYGSDTLAYAQPTPRDIIKHASFRKEKWIYAPTRSFYAWLFKAIKLQDFIAERVDQYQGLFFPSADDLAFMYPMLEMAGERFAYIPTVSYHVNTYNPLSNKKVDFSLQTHSSLDIRERTTYKELDAPKINNDTRYEHAVADILILSDNADDLQELLASIHEFVTHAGTVQVLYTAHKTAHAALAQELPDYEFIVSDMQEIQQAIIKCAHHAPHDHLLIMHSAVTVMQDVSLCNAIKLLEQTSAYGFYFAYTAGRAPFAVQHIFDDVYAWKFACAKYTFYDNLDMTLLRTKDVAKNKHIDQYAIGLCLERPPVEGNLTRCTTAKESPAAYPAQPVKKRRLHVPGRDPRTKDKNKSKKSTKKENHS